jgi:hypothetical protein
MPMTWELDPDDRSKAHTALSRWLAECEREAEHALHGGRHGHIGELKLTASVDDGGITLRVARAFEETL